MIINSDHQIQPLPTPDLEEEELIVSQVFPPGAIKAGKFIRFESQGKLPEFRPNWTPSDRTPERVESKAVKEARRQRGLRILLFTALAGVGVAAFIGFLIWLRFARGPWEVLFR